MKKAVSEIVWKDKKHNFLGMALSFTKYELTKEKLTITTGMLNKNEEEIRLYRVTDITLSRPLGQRLLGLGTIRCTSSDKSSPSFDIKLIRDSKYVKDLLSDLVEEERDKKRVFAREYLTGADETPDND